jgi:hypothetical protein
MTGISAKFADCQVFMVVRRYPKGAKCIRKVGLALKALVKVII